MFNVEEFIDNMDANAFMLFQVVLQGVFITIEMVSDASQLIDPIVGIWDVITTLCTTFALF
jgi:hypothetical protein